MPGGGWSLTRRQALDAVDKVYFYKHKGYCKPWKAAAEDMLRQQAHDSRPALKNVVCKCMSGDAREPLRADPAAFLPCAARVRRIARKRRPH